jgi:hypothetical protein
MIMMMMKEEEEEEEEEEVLTLDQNKEQEISEIHLSYCSSQIYLQSRRFVPLGILPMVI